jgi:hypothetical protein
MSNAITFREQGSESLEAEHTIKLHLSYFGKINGKLILNGW